MLRFILLGLWALPLAAQTDNGAWSLKTCIEYAWQNSLQVKQANLGITQAQLNQKQAFWAQFPSASANVRHSVNFGRSIDLTSYEFVNDITQLTGFSAGINAPLYQGGQLRNGIRQSKVEVEAGKQDLNQVRNDLALAVAQAYLSVLLAEENLGVLQNQSRISQEQLERTLRFIQAGSLPENARFDLDMQIATDQENIVRAENSVKLAYLNLKTQMNMDAGAELRIERMEIALPESVQAWTLEQLYDESVQRMPNLQAARLRQRSAEIGVRIAKGALQPSLSAFGSWSTNYSSRAREVDGMDTIYQTINADLGGVPLTLTFPNMVPQYRNKPFFNQFADNSSFAMGINLQIPIFNNLRTRIGIERAELSVESAKLNSERLQIQLKAEIQRALADAQAAEIRLKAAQKTLTATKTAAENTRKRFESGAINGFELTSVQARLTSAESSLVQAKYEYLFRLKILDYYRGIDLTATE